MPYIDGVECYLTFSHKTFPTPGLVVNEHRCLSKPVWERCISAIHVLIKFLLSFLNRTAFYLVCLSRLTTWQISENSFLHNNIINFWEHLPRIWTVLDSFLSLFLSVSTIIPQNTVFTLLIVLRDRGPGLTTNTSSN